MDNEENAFPYCSLLETTTKKMHAPKMMTETEKELKFFNEARINIQTNMMSIHLECIETQANMR